MIPEIEATPEAQPEKKASVRNLPRNVWAVSATSFFMDVSSEMVLNILPLFLANVLGVKTSIIGVIEGVAEATASILKLFSGWLSDRMHQRKWLAVVGYGLSALSKPFFYLPRRGKRSRRCAGSIGWARASARRRAMRWSPIRSIRSSADWPSASIGRPTPPGALVGSVDRAVCGVAGARRQHRSHRADLSHRRPGEFDPCAAWP